MLIRGLWKEIALFISVSLRRVPDEPVPMSAGLRAANARLRALLEARTRRSRRCGPSSMRRERERRLSCGWRSWSAAWRWTAPTRARPASKERIGAKEARRARQQSERERSKDRKRGGQPGHQGKRPAAGSGSGRGEDRGAAGGVPFLQGGAGRRGGRGLAVGAGHRRGDHPEGDRVAAAGPCVPVLRDGHVRGPAAGGARGRGVLRAGAERRRGAPDLLRERAARAGRAGHRHAARASGSRPAGSTRPPRG